MKDSDWEILYELYKNPNMTKVANLLYMTQPSLTKRLQHMESEFQVTIVNRTPKGLEFTEEGEYLGKQAEKYLDFLKETKDRIKEYQENSEGIITIRQIQHQLLFRCFGKRESVFLTLAHRLGSLFRIFPMVFATCSFAFSSRWRTEGRSDCVRAFVLASSLSAAVKASESRALKNTRTRGLSPSTLRIA